MTELAGLGDVVKAGLPGAVTGYTIAFDQLTVTIEASEPDTTSAVTS